MCYSGKSSEYEARMRMSSPMKEPWGTLIARDLSLEAEVGAEMKLHQRNRGFLRQNAALRANLSSLPVTNGFSHSRRRKRTSISFKIGHYTVLFAFVCLAALVAMKRRSSSVAKSSVATIPFNSGDPASVYRQRFSARQLGYDIYACPSSIPEGYPRAWGATQILTDASISIMHVYFAHFSNSTLILSVESK